MARVRAAISIYMTSTHPSMVTHLMRVRVRGRGRVRGRVRGSKGAALKEGDPNSG